MLCYGPQTWWRKLCYGPQTWWRMLCYGLQTMCWMLITVLRPGLMPCCLKLSDWSNAGNSPQTWCHSPTRTWYGMSCAARLWNGYVPSERCAVQGDLIRATHAVTLQLRFAYASVKYGRHPLLHRHACTVTTTYLEEPLKGLCDTRQLQ